MDLLDALRNPVRKHLQSELERMEYEPHELEAIIERAIESANEVAENREDLMAFPHLLISHIEELALDYLLGVLAQDKKINELNQLINAYKSVFVVGAGISFETGVPLSLHLSHILKFCETSSYEQLRGNVEKSCKFINSAVYKLYKFNSHGFLYRKSDGRRCITVTDNEV